MQIYRILDKIDENQLFVPAFQREYVWKKDDAKNLIASLIRKFPTGTMLTWETNHPPELKGSWKYNELQGAVKLILDGQQRITTLYMLIKGKIPPYYTQKEVAHFPEKLHVNILNLRLEYYKKTIMANDPFWVDVTDIFQRKIREKDILKKLEGKGVYIERDQEDQLSDNFRAIENIPNLEFLEQSVPEQATLKEAIDIFYIVNSSGVNLTDAELALAQISGYWPKARETFKRKLDAMKEEGFVFKLDFIVYCLLGVLHHVGSDMSKLHSAENELRLKEAWKKLDEEVLDYVLNILRTHAYVDHTKEINSVYALVPIVAYVFRKGKTPLGQEEIKKIIKWFYYSQIRQRYVSQLPQKLDKDIGVAVRSEKPFDELIGIIRSERTLEITPEEFIGIDTRHALFSLMTWYFKSKNAVCFTTGIQLRKNMGSRYMLEWDHIFPYSLLKKRGYDRNNRHKYSLAQEITNRAILTKTANRRKGAMLPSDYLAEVKSRYSKALSLQSIPDNEELLDLDNFELFLERRRRMLADELNKFLESLTETEEDIATSSLEDIILEGESNELEFKSSFCWNYEKGEKDRLLEQVVMKTIAAFGNGEGGTLLIGVNDEGEVLGLELDYHILNGDKDQFELHLRNLAMKHFGKVFSIQGISVSFPEVDGKEICKVDVVKSVSPLIFDTVDRNGQKQEKFYVRIGNSSQELKMSDATDYMKTKRFS